MERAEAVLDDFKFRDMPRVAISVDMLDTGIDIPAIQNLVFAKPIFSQVKFWQMIGRGTRLWTDPQTGGRKTDFFILDFWDNFAYFNLNPQGEVANAETPLPVRLFRVRLEKMLVLRGLGEAEAVGWPQPALVAGGGRAQIGLVCPGPAGHLRYPLTVL